ncbi:MAG: hypothetical protein KAU20_01560 [Nanoarchaeota archaeon]|nr:hypothetical protein [Nanoarchaeota archaeon]
MFRNLILKYRVEESSNKEMDIVIDVLIQKVIADASLGTDYVLTATGQEFSVHEKQDDVVEAKVVKREKIDDKTTELVFSVPIYFEEKSDFFPMFLTCTGEPPGFHSNIYLEDFSFEGEDPFKNDLANGPEKYKRYFGREGPFVGTIIKPNLGTDMEKRLDLIKKLMMAGVDFLKDDEVFGHKSFEDFEEYVIKVNKIREEVYKKTGYKALVCFNITSLASKADEIYKLPIDGIMINFLALGFSKSYDLVQKFKGKCIIHGHRVGSAIFLSRIHKNVLIKLASMIGLDSTHIGTSQLDKIEKDSEKLDTPYIKTILATFTKVNPKYVEPLINNFGKDILFLPCGGVYRHPGGFEKGVRAFRTAIDIYNNEQSQFYDKKAFDKALARWGY